MTYKRLFLITLLLVCGLCNVQEELPTISADRPGALIGTDVMPLLGRGFFARAVWDDENNDKFVIKNDNGFVCSKKFSIFAV